MGDDFEAKEWFLDFVVLDDNKEVDVFFVLFVYGVG